jgi:CRP-like cAMP-binding protein
LATQDIRGRVAARILQLAESHGERVEDGGVRISLHLSQATLAGMAGASRENVNRALAGFLAAGDIRRERGRLVVVRPEALRHAL